MSRLGSRLRRLLHGSVADKAESEFAFWRARRAAGGDLEAGAPLYRWYFIDHVGLPSDFYSGKRMLDIGCGPRGSLEWAVDAAERVGLDPLADRYRELQARDHDMAYVNGGAEAIPFPSARFDVISSINSLDHVDDVTQAIAEIARVGVPGATLLLLTDVNHLPTPTEPQTFGWEILDLLAGDWELVERRDFERPSGNMYDNLRAGTPYDHSRGDRPGVLSARFSRKG